VTSSIVTVTAVASLLGGAAGLRAVGRITVSPHPASSSTAIPTSPQPGSGFTSTPPPPGSPATVVVPNLTGLSEGDAVKMLAEVGLLAEIRYQKEAPRTGLVLGTDPPSGSEVEAGSSVQVRIPYEPPLPVPDPAEEQQWNEHLAPVSQLIESNPQAFLGVYRDNLDPGGILVVVFNPGADEDALG
jgi:hypothetical protein